MLKVLIIDDEVLVRVGLKTMIDWEAIGFTIVAEASNGESGYEQYMKYKPDVIITDIRMPKKDGLWLVDQIRKDNRFVKILMLTCYDEFSYAQKALRVGANDYILKSEVEDEELVKIMISIKSEIEVQNKKLFTDDNGIKNEEHFRKLIFADLIEKEFTMDELMINRLKEINFKISNTKFALAIIAIIQKEEMQSDQAPSNQALRNILIGQLNQRDASFLDVQQGNKYIFFMSSVDLNTTELKRIFTVVSNGAKQYFDISLNIVISNVFNDLKMAEEVYKEFELKSQNLFYKNKNSYCITQMDAVKFQETNVFELKKIYNKNIIEAIGQENKEKSDSLIHEVGQHFEEIHANPMNVKIFYSNLMGDIFSSYGLFLENQEEFMTHQYYHYQIEHTEQLESIVRLLTDFSAKVISEIQNMRYNNSKLMINRAINFIENHYQEDISLEDVAKELNISKQYLCSAFKKQTSENMSLYINELRIEKAKQMLLQSDVKIKDIYESVGYSNQQYFSKVFKKITGMTVIEYKESMSK